MHCLHSARMPSWPAHGKVYYYEYLEKSSAVSVCLAQNSASIHLVATLSVSVRSTRVLISWLIMHIEKTFWLGFHLLDPFCDVMLTCECGHLHFHVLLFFCCNVQFVV
jgi:hypothetical protein